MVAITINGLTDERLRGYLGLRTWTPMIGAMLINGWDPHEHDGKQTVLHDSLIKASNSGWLDDALMESLETFVGNRIEDVRITVSKWRSERTSPGLSAPLEFLSWCHYRNVPNIHSFLDRAQAVEPSLIPGYPDTFPNPRLMREISRLMGFELTEAPRPPGEVLRENNKAQRWSQMRKLVFYLRNEFGPDKDTLWLELKSYALANGEQLVSETTPGLKVNEERISYSFNGEGPNYMSRKSFNQLVDRLPDNESSP